MGLTIHYELRLPERRRRRRRRPPPAPPRLRLLTLGAPRPVVRAKSHSPALSFPSPGQDWESGTVEWLIHVFTEVMRMYRDGAVDDIEDRERLAAASFLVYPGEGSESATFGLVRPLLTEPPQDLEHVENAGDWKLWYWQSFCKTQYASTVSEDHLLFCHRMVISVLDEAKRIGFDVTVHDEGQYWETRDAELLLSEVRNSNRIIAHLAGALHDAISPEHSVKAEILPTPNSAPDGSAQPAAATFDV